MITRIATEFHPIRQFKRRRKTRDPHLRMLRKKWYRRNKSKLRTKRRQRYKQLRRNPTWKRWQKKLRHEKVKRHMIGSTGMGVLFVIPIRDSLWLGELTSLDVDADVVRAISAKSRRAVVIPLDIFLRFACFTDAEHEQVFWESLETAYGAEH